MTDARKTYPTIACCGIDCGLCPQFHSKARSSCPGCGGPDFKEKHPSCGILSCCAGAKGHEVCSLCNEFPCKKFDKEKEGFDSFVTHQNVFRNLESIKTQGIDLFVEQQKTRIAILRQFLSDFDDGRSKSFFCQCCALLPVHELEDASKKASNIDPTADLRQRNKQLRQLLTAVAQTLNINITLHHKK